MKKILKLFCFLSLILMFTNCNIAKLGTYKSSCKLYHQTELILKLEPNNFFSYQFLNNPNIILGSWSTKSDTLILGSGYFKTSTDSLFPITKISDLPNQDKYLVRGRKLFVINKAGKSNDCFLIKSN